MAQYQITNHLCFPTNLDINGGSVGGGKKAPESTLRDILRVLGRLGGGVISGFNLPPSGSISQGIPGGVAVVGSYLVSGTGTITMQYDDNQASVWVWLRLLKDANGEVTTAIIETRTTATPIADALLLGRVGTSAGNIINVNDARAEGREIWGTIEYATSGPTWKPFSAGSGNWQVTSSGTKIRVDFLPALTRSPTFASCWRLSDNLFCPAIVNSASQVDFERGALTLVNGDKFCFMIRG